MNWLKQLLEEEAKTIKPEVKAKIVEACRFRTATIVAKEFGVSEAVVRYIREQAGLKPLGPNCFMGVVLPRD